ncbi:MAG: DUF4129 domain-containing protein [Gemmatimonadaceae bacterium]|nr:DUF4129 domain-containing protein [Gemmatimonadaceae bacterium]
MFVPQDSSTAWAKGAVHDTVAAIARLPVFERALGDSVGRQFWRWFGRVVSELFGFFRDSSAGRSLVMAFFALLLVLIIVRVWMGERALLEIAPRDDPDLARTQGADAWVEAERLAAAGDFTHAAHALFAALLAACASRGELRLHPSKTTGDYARELRHRGVASQRDFRTFRSRYDRIIYGAGECTATDYSALLSDAGPLLGRSGAP